MKATCILKDERIDVWQFPLHTPISCDALLSDSEKNRANRYHFDHHRRRFRTARSALRLILSRYTGIPAATLEFSYNAHGKPKLLHADSIEFNLSHSGDIALLAVGSTYPLGVDIETYSARPYLGIGLHIFSEKENAALAAINNALLPLAFFNLWTQKESLIKACGIGLSYPTKHFDLELLPPASIEIIDPLDKKPWRIISWMPSIGILAALSHHPKVAEIKHHALFDLSVLSK